jgi:O-Antigen ligase
MGLTPLVSQNGVRFLADVPARIGSLLAGLACAALLYSRVTSSVPAAVVLVGLVVLTTVNPVAGVLVSAALVPVAGPAFTALVGQGGEWGEALILATIAGFLLRRMVGLEQWPSGAAARWGAIFVAAVLASALVQLAVIRTQLSPSLFWTSLGELMRGYLNGPTEVGNPVRPALQLLEGTAIVMIVAALRRVPGTPERVLHMFLVGACGAAALNLSRMAGAVLRSEAPVAALAALLRSVRISVPFADVNAAGSFFAMAVGVAAGLAATTSGRTRAGWLGAAALCAAALLTTGSRTAILAAFFFVLVATLVRLGRVRALRFALLACAVGALAVVVLPNPLAGRNTSDALNMRVELARAAGRMIEVKPFFGIGIGQFYSRSGQFIHRPQGRPMYFQENAHNNFLQIGGELGLVGLIAFVSMLFSIARPAIARLRSTEMSPALFGAAVGLGVFLVTCLAGHPLLISEVALPFWVVVGATAAAAPEADGPSPVPRRLVIAAAIAIAMTIPSRMTSAIAETNLEHRGWGLSGWRFDDEGNRYRRMEGNVTLFVARDARVAELPYRLETAGPPVVLDVRLRGERAERITVTETSWRIYRFIVDPRLDDPRFLPMTITSASGDASRVLLGRIDVHPDMRPK